MNSHTAIFEFGFFEMEEKNKAVSEIEKNFEKQFGKRKRVDYAGDLIFSDKFIYITHF